MTDSELMQLALDVVGDKVFGSWMVPEAEQEKMLPLIFLPLLFGGADRMQQAGAVSLYQYRNKAGKKQVLGYPNFATCCFLTKEELTKLVPLIEQLGEISRKLRGENARIVPETAGSDKATEGSVGDGRGAVEADGE